MNVHSWGATYFKPVRTVVVALIAMYATDRTITGLETVSLTNAIQRQLNPSAIALKANLDERIALLTGVASFLSLHWDKPSLDSDFIRFARILLREQSGVRTVQYIIDGKIKQTWPITGNEAAIGLRLSDTTPEGSPSGYRQSLKVPWVVLTTPAPLAQGGVGIVARVAVRDTVGRVVSVAAIVIDRDSIVHFSGIDDVPELLVSLIDEHEVPIAGELDLGDDQPDDPVGAPVYVADRQWQLRAVPRIGWNAMIAQRTLVPRIGFGVFFLLTGTIALVFGSRNRALAEVERQKAKQRGEEKFVKLFAMTPDGVVLTRLVDGQILEFNSGFAEICQRSREELQGANTVALGLWPSNGDRESFVTWLRKSGSISDYAVALQRPDGELRETRISGRLVEIDGLECLLAIVRDVHDQRILERRLEEAARLEAVGRLAGGVAHDFNNMLAAILGYAHILAGHLQQDNVALADLHEITRASNRAKNLTAQLLAFARRQVVQPRVVDLNDQVLDSHVLLRNLAGDHIELATTLSPTSARILIDPAQVDQLLTNLCINARDAMPEGGTLRIHVATQEATVTLSVSDSGTGVPREVLPHLFEPFYTTKAAGRGTGLGLATCYGIMQQANGKIEVSSPPGNGAIFTLTFPRVADDIVVPLADTVSSGRTLHQMSGETILIAEDEVQLRRLCERVLRNLGYNVLTGENGTDALAVAAEYPGVIDLLLTDMVMPVMGGTELMRKMAEVRPATKLMMMSGFSDELVAAEHVGIPFIQKPFTPAELASAVRRSLTPAES